MQKILKTKFGDIFIHDAVVAFYIDIDGNQEDYIEKGIRLSTTQYVDDTFAEIIGESTEYFGELPEDLILIEQLYTKI